MTCIFMPRDCQITIIKVALLFILAILFSWIRSVGAIPVCPHDDNCDKCLSKQDCVFVEDFLEETHCTHGEMLEEYEIKRVVHDLTDCFQGDFF
jgi:hypothetical protein